MERFIIDTRIRSPVGLSVQCEIYVPMVLVKDNQTFETNKQVVNKAILYGVFPDIHTSDDWNVAISVIKWKRQLHLSFIESFQSAIIDLSPNVCHLRNGMYHNVRWSIKEDLSQRISIILLPFKALQVLYGRQEAKWGSHQSCQLKKQNCYGYSAVYQFCSKAASFLHFEAVLPFKLAL